MIDLKNLVLRRKAKWDVQVLTTLLASMKQRIHNTGTATNGTLIAEKYSDGWKLTRSLEGRQVGFVDLEFRGDLRKDFVLGSFDGQAVLGFTTDLSTTKSLGLEEKYEKKIYTPSDDEVNDLIEIYNESMDALFAEIFGNIGKNLKDGSSS